MRVWSSITIVVVGGLSSANDPPLGQFLSPDTLVPDAGLVLDDNRYMYVRGNPLKYTDPSGHCGVVADGEIPDDEAECWQHAVDIWMHWNGNPDYWQRLFRMSRDDFWIKIASDPHQRAAQLKEHVDNYWFEFHQRTGSPHAQYNPAPKWDEPPPHPIENIDIDCENADCTGRFLNGVSTVSSVVAAGCTAFVVTGPCAPVATFVGMAAGGFATWRAGEKAIQPDATSVDVIDVVMSAATTVAGGLSHPYIGPLISAGQWTYDEYISPAMR